jgi:putative tricarboxylic transport membrane protein
MNFLKGDRVGGFIWLVLGIGQCIGSFKLSVGAFHNPGPGFMPALSGTFLGLSGLVLMLRPISKELGEETEVKVEKSLKKENQKKLLFTFLTLFGYIVLFEHLGFLLSTFLFFFFLFKLTDPRRWLMPSIFSVTAVILCYLIFSVWLKCSLPIGIIRF